MTDIFLYGTLRHIPLLEQVLGRPVDPSDQMLAHLDDFAVFRVQGKEFPALQSAKGGTAKGLLLRNLSKTDVARLSFYEDAYEYDLHALVAQPDVGDAVKAMVFLPQPGRWPVGAEWSLKTWSGRLGAIVTRAAVEVMDHFGKRDPAEVARRYPGFLIRAAAWVAAQGRQADPVHDLACDVVVHAHHRCYSNFFAAEEMDLQYRRFDGSLSPVLNRGAQVLGPAVVVLPYDPIRDSVLLVQQFRTPVFIGGDRSPWVWDQFPG